MDTDEGKVWKILYEHYIKEIASKFVIERESAMAMSAKRTILTQMCLRVMLNCSPDAGETTRKKHVEYFMRRIQASGYDEAFRYEVLKSAVHAVHAFLTRTGDRSTEARRRTHPKGGRRRPRKEGTGIVEEVTSWMYFLWREKQKILF